MPLKIAPTIGEFEESATVFAESRTVCGIHQQIIRHVDSYIELLRNPQIVSGILKLYVESRFHLHFVDATYILRNLHKEPQATFACCGIRNITSVPTKITLQVFVR